MRIKMAMTTHPQTNGRTLCESKRDWRRVDFLPDATTSLERLRASLALWLIASLALLPAPAAFANPEGGRVAAGQAQIHLPSETRLEVTQHSNRAIIEWQSFDIDAGETTHFNQPANGFMLNRIPDATQASQILGTLSATGNVAVINPSGVIIGNSGRVDTAGFLATTTDIPDADFMAGRLDFSIPGMADGLVANHGTIRVRDGGFAALVAPWVENSGEIHATLGRVDLAAGEAFTLDFYGDGLIEFDTGNSAAGRHLSHSGEIVADGGVVALTLQDAANVLESVINLEGVIQANRIENVGGKIVLRGGPDTRVEITGELLALGDDRGETGGRIEVLGGTVELASSAVIDASGEAGGGEVRVGGDFHGAQSLLSAEETTIREGAVLRANASASGDAGGIAIWADGNTEFRGRVEASAVDGEGGFVEVSGKRNLLFRGEADLAGSTGAGTLLLDPAFIVIGAADDPDRTILNTDLSEMLRSGMNFEMLADMSVTVNDEVDGRRAGGAAGDGNLTLRAMAGDIILNDDLITGDGNILLESIGGDVRMTTVNSGSYVNGDNPNATGTGLFSTSGDLTIITQSATSNIEIAYLQTVGDITVSSAGDVSTGVIGDAGNGARLFGLIDTRGAGSTGMITIEAGGDLEVGTDLASDSGAISLDADGAFTQLDGTVIEGGSGDVAINAGGETNLSDIGTSGKISVESGAGTTVRGDLEGRGTARGGDAIEINATGDISLEVGASLIAANDAILLESSEGGISIALPDPVPMAGMDGGVESNTGIEATTGNVTLAAMDDISSGFISAGEVIDISSTDGAVAITGLIEGGAAGANAVQIVGQSVGLQDRVAGTGDVLVSALAGNLDMSTGAAGREAQVRSESGSVTLRSVSSGGDDGDITLLNVGTNDLITIDSGRDVLIQGLIGRDGRDPGETAIDSIAIDATRDVLFSVGGLVRSEGQSIDIAAGRDLTIPFEMAGADGRVATGVDARFTGSGSTADGGIDLVAGRNLRAAQIEGLTLDLSATSGLITIDGLLQSTEPGVAAGDLGIQATGQSIAFAATGELVSENGISLTAQAGSLDTRSGRIFSGDGDLNLTAQGAVGDVLLGDAASRTNIVATAGRDLRIAGLVGNGDTTNATTGTLVGISASAARNLIVEGGSLVASSGGGITLVATSGTLTVEDNVASDADGISAGSGSLSLTSDGLLEARNLASSGLIDLASLSSDVRIVGVLDGLLDATGSPGASIEVDAARNILIDGPIDTNGNVTLVARDGDIDMDMRGGAALMGIDARTGTLTFDASQGLNGSGSAFVTNAVAANLVFATQGDLELSGIVGTGAESGPTTETQFTIGGEILIREGGLLRTNGGGIDIALASGGFTIEDADETGIVAGSGNVTVSASGDVLLGDIESAGLIDIRSTGGTLTLSESGTIDGEDDGGFDGGVALNGANGLTLLGDIVSDGDVALVSATGGVSMTDLSGAVGQVETTAGAIAITALAASADITTGRLSAPGGITIDAGRDVNVDGLIDVKDAPAALAGPGLTIDAGQDLFVNAEIQTADADVDLDATRDIVIAASPSDPATSTITSTGDGDLDLAAGGRLTVRGSIKSESAGNIMLLAGDSEIVLIEGSGVPAVAAIESAAGAISIDGGGVLYAADVVSDSGNITLRARTDNATVGDPIGEIATQSVTTAAITSDTGALIFEAAERIQIDQAFSSGALIMGGIEGGPSPEVQLFTPDGRSTLNDLPVSFLSVDIDGSQVDIESVLDAMGDVTINATSAETNGINTTMGGGITITTTGDLGIAQSLFSNGGAITLGGGLGGTIYIAPETAESEAVRASWLYAATRGLVIDSSVGASGDGGDITFLDEIIARPVLDGLIGSIAAREFGFMDLEFNPIEIDRNVFFPNGEVAMIDVAIPLAVPIIGSYETILDAGTGVIAFSGVNLFDAIEIVRASRITGRTMPGAPSEAPMIDAHQVEGILLGQEPGAGPGDDPIAYDTALVIDGREQCSGECNGAEGRYSLEIVDSDVFSGEVSSDVAVSQILPSDFTVNGEAEFPSDPGFLGEGYEGDSFVAYSGNGAVAGIANQTITENLRRYGLTEIVSVLGPIFEEVGQIPQTSNGNYPSFYTALIDAESLASGGSVTFGYGTSVELPDGLTMDNIQVNLRDMPSAVGPYPFTGMNFDDQPPQPNAIDLPAGGTDLPSFSNNVARTNVSGGVDDFVGSGGFTYTSGYAGTDGSSFEGGFDSPGDLALFGNLDNSGSTTIEGNAGSAGPALTIPGSGSNPDPGGGDDTGSAVEDGGISSGEVFVRQQDEEEAESETEKEEELAAHCPTDSSATAQTTPSRAAFATSVVGNPYTIDTFCGRYDLVSGESGGNAYEGLTFVESNFWIDRSRSETPTPPLVD